MRPGETVLAEWRPALRIWGRKVLFVTFVTALALGLAGWWLQFWPLLAALPVAMAVWFVVFDDWQDWRRHRDDRWWLTGERLIFDNGDDMDPLAWSELSDLVKVQPWMWWALRLRFADGRATMMHFLPDRARVRARLLAARDAHTGAAR